MENRIFKYIIEYKLINFDDLLIKIKQNIIQNRHIFQIIPTKY